MRRQLTAFLMAWGSYCAIPCPIKRWDDEGNGVYARVKSVVVSLSSSVFLGSNKVRTVNNTAYNVKIERKPLLGALSKNVGFFSPANYQNGLFYYPGSNVAPRLYPYKVHFTGQTSANDIPLPVAIHEQILCFYFGAARVLSGRLAPINKAMMRFDRVFLYKGVKYLLQGGTFDMFSGIVESAVLREYAVFDDLWTGTPSWSDDADYNSSSTGGGGSSSAGGGGGSRPETDPVFSASPAAGIPAVTSGDNGKILKVSNGAYALGSETVVEFGSYDSTKKTVMLTVGGSTREIQQYGYDTSLDEDSTNAVQNKVIYAAIGDIETLLAAL